MMAHTPLYLPSPTQHLLMKAVLLKGEAALDAWQAWKSAINLNDVDYPSLRLLPMLYQNLKENNAPDDPDLQRMKGVYRLSWVQNQLLFRRLSEILRRFEDQGIKTVILKGGALVFGYYHDYGVRPMHDLDIMVKWDQLNVISEILGDIGWHQQHICPERLQSYRRETVFENDAEQEIDIHWHLLREWCMPEHDAAFWTNTTTLPMNDMSMTALNPTYSLMHLCGHGYQWSTLPSLLWIADIHKIITTASDQIEWDPLMLIASRYNLTIPLRNVLAYLADDLETSIPLSVLGQSRQASPSPQERSIHDAFSGNPNTISRVVRKHWFYYAATRHREGKRTSVIGFIHYFCLHFQDCWGLKRWWTVPFYSLRLLCKRNKT